MKTVLKFLESTKRFDPGQPVRTEEEGAELEVIEEEGEEMTLRGGEREREEGEEEIVVALS